MFLLCLDMPEKQRVLIGFNWQKVSSKQSIDNFRRRDTIAGLQYVNLLLLWKRPYCEGSGANWVHVNCGRTLKWVIASLCFWGHVAHGKQTPYASLMGVYSTRWGGCRDPTGLVQCPNDWKVLCPWLPWLIRGIFYLPKHKRCLTCMGKSIYLRLKSNFGKIHSQLCGNLTKHNPDTWTVKWDTRVSWIDFDLVPIDEI